MRSEDETADSANCGWENDRDCRRVAEKENRMIGASMMMEKIRTTITMVRAT